MMTERIKLTEDNVDIYDMAVRIWVGGMGADNKQRCQNMVKQILEDQEKAEILEIGQENSIFKVAKFCEMLAEWKRENKELKNIGQSLTDQLMTTQNKLDKIEDLFRYGLPLSLNDAADVAVKTQKILEEKS